jgi:hypothetical protein
MEQACGDRMPGLQDYAQLPTLRACIKEALRWRPSVPLGEWQNRADAYMTTDWTQLTAPGVPHRCEETIEYEGVTIEKDTIVMSCEWSVLNIIPQREKKEERKV